MVVKDEDEQRGEEVVEAKLVSEVESEDNSERQWLGHTSGEDSDAATHVSTSATEIDAEKGKEVRESVSAALKAAKERGLRSYSRERREDRNRSPYRARDRREERDRSGSRDRRREREEGRWRDDREWDRSRSGLAHTRDQRIVIDSGRDRGGNRNRGFGRFNDGRRQEVDRCQGNALYERDRRPR